ncbi:MAG: SAM-dependent methyltransferase [Oscillospiraceae bacterium]|nr:SAM-dependent methyltransferase [Oscillospiraceae bacterium]
MEELNKHLETIFGDAPSKIVLSKPPKDSEFRRICAVKKEKGYQLEKYTEKQVFHENLDSGQAMNRCEDLIRSGWRQLNAWGQSDEYALSVSKKGKLLFSKKRITAYAPAVDTGHDRKKNYIIPEDKPFPALVDMGVFTKDGRVAKPMYDKFRQINRFAEIIDDAVRERKLPDRPLNIVDFGCGKSYLTFVLYHYFTEIRGIDVRMLGLDLKADVIEKCNAAARKYGYKNLSFERGDIESASVSGKVDMVVTLHACDTATDFALHNAVMREADMIFSVPCCQHELGGQMRSDNFGILTRYGIIKERVAALCTDAIRADLLEYCGYKTQLLEFIDFEHTPKNILIRAVRKGNHSPKREPYLSEAERLMREFSFEPTLYRLLKESGKIK